MGIRRATRYVTALAAVLAAVSAARAQDVQTIAPGMTTDEVKATFGEPRGVSARGPFTYYFFDNGCEYECGFPDLVVFEDGQVVDAVLRAPRHEYAGESSSPKGTVARPTPGGMRLQVPSTVETVESVQGVEVRQTEMPPPVPVAPADTTPAVEVVPTAVAPAEMADEFENFVQVCQQAMAQAGLTAGDARVLCRCTSDESRALGVEPSVMADMADRVAADPAYQAEDERIRQAASTCFDRLTSEAAEGAEADTTGT